MTQKTADRIIKQLVILCVFLFSMLILLISKEVKSQINIFNIGSRRLFNLKIDHISNIDSPELENPEKIKNSKRVLVTAYNSVPDQTDDDPFIAAWGDKLENGMKVIAVSRDLEEIGLTKGKVVHIQGMGEYIVLDRMHKRKRKQIDIYMGEDVKRAIKFGVKNLRITWVDDNKKEEST